VANALSLAALLLLGAFASAEADSRLECPSQDVDRAIRGCTVAIRTGGANLPVAYANRCVAFWFKGAYARAAADCDQAIQHGANVSAAFLIRGTMLADKGDNRGAIADYSRSLDLMPTASAYYNRGTAHLVLDESALALVDFDRAIAAQPAMPQPHINRALALLAGGRTEDMVAELDRGVELLANDTLAFAIRTQILDVLERKRAGFPDGVFAVAKPALQPFPPSKVLPQSMSLEALFDGAPLHLAPSPTRTPALPADSPRVFARPATARDSLADCIRLWHPETGTTQSRWKEICQRLDFGPGSAGMIHKH